MKPASRARSRIQFISFLAFSGLFPLRFLCPFSFCRPHQPDSIRGPDVVPPEGNLHWPPLITRALGGEGRQTEDEQSTKKRP
jgi:hypothetical protein